MRKLWILLALASGSGCSLLVEDALDDDDPADAAAAAAGGASSSAGPTSGPGASSAGGAGSSSGPGPGGAGPGPGGATGSGGSPPCGGACEAGFVCDGTSCLCQAPPTPAAVDCPAPCTSCDLPAGLCVVALTGDHKKDNIQCPDGMACRFECGAEKGCEEAKLRCPADQACEVWCSDVESCKKAMIFGGNGGITIQCTGNGCKDAELKCGEGPCIHPCPLAMEGPLKVDCGSSCSCQGCGP